MANTFSDFTQFPKQILPSHVGEPKECPVSFAIYWDGTHIKSYAPYAGNPYNSDLMTAYGHLEYYDLINAKKRFPEIWENADAEQNYEYYLNDVARKEHISPKQSKIIPYQDFYPLIDNVTLITNGYSMN